MGRRAIGSIVDRWSYRWLIANSCQDVSHGFQMFQVFQGVFLEFCFQEALHWGKT